MVTSESSRFIDDLVRKYIHLALRPKGFVRKARTWTRSARGFVDFVGVQAGRWNEPNRGDFTINLGLFVPSVYSIVWGTPAPLFVKEADCTIRVRLGALMDRGVLRNDVGKGENRDYRWDFTSASGIGPLGNSVTKAIIEKGLPFLEGLGTLDSVHDFLESYCASSVVLPLDFINLAVVKAELGKHVEAVQLFAETYRRFDDWHEWVLGAAHRLDLDLTALI